MPIHKHYVCTTRNGYTQKGQQSTYVPGTRLTKRQKRVMEWGWSEHEFAWHHTGIVPPISHFLWIVPFHAFVSFIALCAVTARTDGGMIFLGLVSAGLSYFMWLFWRHMYRNAVVVRLQRLHPVPYGNQQFDMLISAFGNEKRHFSQWLSAQLQPEGPYFSQIQPMIDEYLDVTRQPLELQDALKLSSVPWRQLYSKAAAAGETAASKIRPIYEQALDNAEQLAKEQRAKEASATAYRQGEEAKLTQQRVNMASERLDVYISGHKALMES